MIPMQGKRRRNNQVTGDPFKAIKIKIPKFKGRSDPEAYLEWESKIEMVFRCQDYTKEQKVKLAVIEFFEYAVVWWDQLCLSRRRNRLPEVPT